MEAIRFIIEIEVYHGDTGRRVMAISGLYIALRGVAGWKQIFLRGRNITMGRRSLVANQSKYGTAALCSMAMGCISRPPCGTAWWR